RVLADVLFNQYERYAQLKTEDLLNHSSDLLTPREKSERRAQLKRQVEIETEAALSEILDDTQLSHLVKIREEEKLKPGG
ncbi:MAG: hypothetical protein JXX29_18135, partial [Deltaproteobacteria bacterium]|nr:hypothetical protein [Deltaproteobacteria bacterium]MBN2673604.1 hypothetical protein [Deltaproteobacteria bacterium]